MEFQDAKVTMENEPEEVRMSTDDLLFMLGEAAVRDRQNLKRLQFLDKQIEIARQETLKAKSLVLGCEEKNLALERVKYSLEARISDLERVKTSLDARISQLENQLNEIAQDQGYVPQ